MRLKAPLKLFLALGLIFLWSPAARAAAVLPLPLENLFSEADLVVAGTVVSMESKPNPHGTSPIITEIEIQAETVFLGRCDDIVLVRVPGGRIGERRLKVIGAPEFEPDDRVLLALERDGRGAYRVRGFFQGRFSLVPSEKGGGVSAVQDPWRRALRARKNRPGDPARFLEPVRVKLTQKDVRRLCGEAP